MSESKNKLVDLPIWELPKLRYRFNYGGRRKCMSYVPLKDINNRIRNDKQFLSPKVAFYEELTMFPSKKAKEEVEKRLKMKGDKQ